MLVTVHNPSHSLGLRCLSFTALVAIRPLFCGVSGTFNDFFCTSLDFIISHSRFLFLNSSSTNPFHCSATEVSPSHRTQPTSPACARQPEQTPPRSTGSEPDPTFLNPHRSPWVLYQRQPPSPNIGPTTPPLQSPATMKLRLKSIKRGIKNLFRREHTEQVYRRLAIDHAKLQKSLADTPHHGETDAVAVALIASIRTVEEQPKGNIFRGEEEALIATPSPELVDVVNTGAPAMHARQVRSRVV